MRARSARPPMRHRKAAWSASFCRRRASSRSSASASTALRREFSRRRCCTRCREAAQQSLAGVGAVSEAARPAAAIRRAGAPHDREPLSQWRSRPARRRAAHGAAIALLPDTSLHAHQHPAPRASNGATAIPPASSSIARYFEIFDTSTTMLIERALGMKQDRISQGLRFRRPSAGRRPAPLSARRRASATSRDRDHDGRPAAGRASRSSTA